VLDSTIGVYTLIEVDGPIDLRLCASCHCLAARQNARAITRLYDDHLRGHGLKATQFSVLVALALRGASPIGALARGLGLERTTLTRSAAVLEQKGWIAADRSADPRARPIKLTASGRRKLEAAFPAWKAAQDAAAAAHAQTSPVPPPSRRR
jgi:DNA-binding MarR family transcriptional regulator